MMIYIKMNLKKYLKNLEKRKIISKKPHPIIPFILAFIIYILGTIIQSIDFKIWSTFLFTLAIFSFIFAIAHLIVFIILNTKQ